MRIAFVQTYPIYHDLLSTEQWLSRDNRDRWMPTVVAGMGHDVELWGGDRTTSGHEQDGDEYRIRLFETTDTGSRTKFHFSDALVEYARTFQPDLCVFKGVDGGVGIRLIESFLKPRSVPYAFVIGGKFYTKHVPDAAAVLYEVDAQRRRLLQPDWPWRRPVDERRLIRLPKTIDIQRFCPMPSVKKEWDILSVGRLVAKYKNYDALGRFPDDIRMAVAGGGPVLERLRSQYPAVSWLGAVGHADIPSVMNKARLFFHTSKRDFFPRVLAEAAACGIPAVAFEDAIGADVLPGSRGLRINRHNMVEQVQSLLADPSRLQRMSEDNRSFAETEYSLSALDKPIRAMLRLAFGGNERG